MDRGIKSIFKADDKSGKVELIYTKEKDGTTPLSQELTEKLKYYKFPIDNPKEMELLNKAAEERGASTSFKVRYYLQESSNESIFKQITKVKKQLWK